MGKQAETGRERLAEAQWSRWRRILAVVVLAAAVIIGAPAIRGSILRAAGWALVIDEPLEPADIVVIAIDADGAGVLEAADLVHSGIARRVAVFADPPDSVDREFIRRGIPYEDAAARSVRQLGSLGVTAIEQIPKTETGTEAEGEVLPGWCDQHQFRSVVVVTTPDHSRRLSGASSIHERPPDQSHGSIRASRGIRPRPMVENS